MQLVVGHTTHDSSWIWVRGDRNDRRLQVELKALDCPERDRDEHADEVEVEANRDYTGVVRFDSVLKPCRPYKVTVRSAETREVIVGQLRTFPEPPDAQPFHFLHGSCNLSTARLTALGSTAVALLGSAATGKALELPYSEWDVDHLPWYAQWLHWSWARASALRVSRFANRLPLAVTYLTRFEQEKPKLLPSPFQRILDNAVDNKDPMDRPAFMIHCGDQIYFDVDFPDRQGTQKDYRRNYRQAWFDDEGAAHLLRNLPHYMILDDHEVWDGFGNDPGGKGEELREAALAAYEEYVASRQRQRDSSGSFHYTFEHGDTGFFVLDTRTQRSAAREQMIGEVQLPELEKWLTSNDPKRPYGLRFVVSSVPFVAQLRPPGHNASGERRDDERADNWSGATWQAERERIIRTIYEHGVERVVFLVGDMHCTYHARMQIGEPRRRLTIHELAGGPINQVLFAKREQFYDRYSDSFKIEHEKSDDEVVPWTSTLEAFHGAAPSVLEVSVKPQSENAPLEINWKALRTHGVRTDDPNLPNLSKPKPRDPHDLCGRIRFHRQPRGSS